MSDPWQRARAREKAPVGSDEGANKLHGEGQKRGVVERQVAFPPFDENGSVNNDPGAHSYDHDSSG